MSEWKYAQGAPSEKLAKLHFFSVQKQCASGPIDVRITVWEYATPDIGDLQFFAQADTELNQGTAPFRPCGWGNTLLGALSDCLRNMGKFQHEPSRTNSAGAGE
jgi:hypothetical protein